ncbi:MAG: hypothetical protein R2787_09330 [Saprospiraceae bacterium]
MASDSLQTVFTMLFGSYFGDWDYPNNFLRAAIASGSTLVSTWGNRPNWIFHHMALGEHTGYAAQVTMNNSSLYWAGYSRRFVHIGLMGDPTLRMHILPPVSNLTLTRDGMQVHLDWAALAGAAGITSTRRQHRMSPIPCSINRRSPIRITRTPVSMKGGQIYGKRRRTSDQWQWVVLQSQQWGDR